MNRQERDTHITSILLERMRKKAVLIALFFLPFIAINPGFNFNIGDMFLLIALVLSISKFRLISKVQIILLLFMITVLPSFWLSLFRRSSNIDILNYGQFFYVFVLLVPFGYVIFKDVSFDSIAKVYTLSGAVNACFGITQFLSSGSLFLSGQRVIKVSEFGFRATGLTTNPDELGFTLNIALIMCLYLILTEKSKIIKLIYIGIAILLVGGILSSVSLAALVMLFLIMVFLIFIITINKGGKAIIVGAVGASVLIVLIGYLYLFSSTNVFISALKFRILTTENVSVRLEQYKRAIAIAEEWIVIGNGPMSDQESIESEFRVHNHTLAMAVQSGAIPALLYVAIYIITALYSFKKSKTDHAALAICIIMSTSLIVFQVRTPSFLRIDYIPILLGTSYMIYGSQCSILPKKNKNG